MSWLISFGVVIVVLILVGLISHACVVLNNKYKTISIIASFICGILLLAEFTWIAHMVLYG